MKKHLLKLLLLCCVGILAISLVACVPSTEQYKLDFVVDGEVYFSRETNGYSRINPPTDPDKEGFIFEGWYFDEGTWSEKYFAHSLEQNPIHQDTKVYAKFKIDESHTCKAGGWEVVLKSTCKQEGSQIKRCTICKKTMDSEVIPISTEHGTPYVVKEQVVNATCVATGSYLDVSYCSVCNRKLSEKRIFPAMNLNKSGTRREDLLLDQEELEAIWAMRRAMSNQNPQEVTEEIIENLAHTKNNKDFIQIIKKVLLED